MVGLLSDAMFIIQAGDPYKTGRLKNSFEYNILEDGFEIFTDLHYMQYTEEAWAYNSRWGKTLINPNERWFEKRVETIAEYIAMKGGGNVAIK